MGLGRSPVGGAEPFSREFGQGFECSTGRRFQMLFSRLAVIENDADVEQLLRWWALVSRQAREIEL